MGRPANGRRSTVEKSSTSHRTPACKPTWYPPYQAFSEKQQNQGPELPTQDHPAAWRPRWPQKANHRRTHPLTAPRNRGPGTDGTHRKARRETEHLNGDDRHYQPSPGPLTGALLTAENPEHRRPALGVEVSPTNEPEKAGAAVQLLDKVAQKTRSLGAYGDGRLLMVMADHCYPPHCTEKGERNAGEPCPLWQPRAESRELNQFTFKEYQFMLFSI